VIERVMKPHTGKADPHIHFDYVEGFEVMDGTATIEVDGRAVSAGTGAGSYRAGLPIWLQKPVIALGAALGRMRGLKPGYD
jgi:hypothetical protein